MFFGNHTLPLIEKNRLALPTKYRETLGRSAYLTPGFDGNLLLLSQQAFSTLYAHVNSTSITDPLSRLMRRLILGGAVEVAIDTLGRVELPPNLCAHAGLDTEITIIGQGEYLELWSPDLWQKQMTDLNKADENNHRFEKFHIPLD